MLCIAIYQLVRVFVVWYEGRSINKLQNGVILSVFKIWKIWKIDFVGISSGTYNEIFWRWHYCDIIFVE